MESQAAVFLYVLPGSIPQAWQEKNDPRIKTLELYFLFGFSQLMNMEVYATKIIKTSSDNYEPTGYSTTIE